MEFYCIAAHKIEIKKFLYNILDVILKTLVINKNYKF